MLLLSCANCCHNALQYDTVGTSYGYCAQHRVVLRVADELTCGQHLRKDLPIGTAQRLTTLHEARYSPDQVSLLTSNGHVDKAEDLVDRDAGPLASDDVSQIVSEYGDLNAKIESLARLRQLEGARAEVALLALGRAYVRRCVERRGPWTSGLHMLWWTRRRLPNEPSLNVTDLRVPAAVPLERQIELAKWSIMMLRLIFISDVAHYAKDERDRVGRLADLAEQAADATQTLSSKKLLRWTRREAIPRFDKELPEARYRELARALHQDT